MRKVGPRGALFTTLSCIFTYVALHICAIRIRQSFGPLCAADIMYIARFYGRRRAGIHAAEKKDWVRRTN